MALASAVRGALRPAQAITWQREGGGAENLTAAALSGWIRNRATGATRPIAGTLTVTDGPAGMFRWDYAAADVAEAGAFDVQFNAAFGAGATPARTFLARWNVGESLGSAVADLGDVYAGDTLQIVATVVDEAGADLDLTGAALAYVLVDSATGAAAVSKTTDDGITVSGNVATITIGAGETSGLAAAHHELQATDTAGNVSTLMTGTVTFTPTEIAP